MAGDEVGWVSRGQKAPRDLNVFTHTQVNKVLSLALHPSALSGILFSHLFPSQAMQTTPVPPNGSQG